MCTKTVTAAIASKASVSARELEPSAMLLVLMYSGVAFNVVFLVRMIYNQARNNKKGDAASLPRRPSCLIRSYFLAGEVLSRKPTNGWAAEGTDAPPSTIALALIALPYSALFASSSESMDAPSSDTPANKPFDRE